MVTSDSSPFASPIRVLVIDDDPQALVIMEAYARSFGFHFFGLDDPRLAIEVALSVMPDVILTDAMMPGVSGFEVCRQLRESESLRLIPIVMITSLDSTQDRVRALDLGATDFMSKPVDRAVLDARVRSLGQLKRLIDTLDSAERVLNSLALCAEARDRTTGEHCERLRREGRRFGEYLRLDSASVVALERAGYLHDIGKIAIPDAVLQKTGKLTPEEWTVMKSHSVIGADLLAPLSTMSRVLPIVRHHHERWDGAGYPDGLTGEQIPYLARVFQLLDSWDALTHERPYKTAMPPSEALALLTLEAAEGRWDPALFEQFKNWKETTL